MGIRMENAEKLSARFKREAQALKKVFFHKLPALECINDIKVADKYQGTFGACRNTEGGWIVYKLTKTTGDFMREKIALRTNLSLAEALNLLNEACPYGMKKNQTRHNHPAKVAELIGHTFSPFSRTYANVIAPIEKSSKKSDFRLRL